MNISPLYVEYDIADVDHDLHYSFPSNPAGLRSCGADEIDGRAGAHSGEDDLRLTSQRMGHGSPDHDSGLFPRRLEKENPDLWRAGAIKATSGVVCSPVQKAKSDLWGSLSPGVEKWRQQWHLH